MSKRQKSISSDAVPPLLLSITSILQKISIQLTVLFAKKLFTSPIKHKIPKREYEMDKDSKQELIIIPKINKKIIFYHYGIS